MADFDPSTPSIARVYDYLLGGKDNHSVPEFASFFGALGLVPPGVVDAREWRPD